MSLDSEVVVEIAAELGIAPAFVEKDWYAVQALKAISHCKDQSVTTIFSGGTCLSKAHKLIKRFSEDLDFRCRYEQPCLSGAQQKIRRREYREKILATMSVLQPISLDQEKVAVASNYVKFPLGYPQLQVGHESLRPNLEIEFSFTQPRLEPSIISVSSLVAEFTKQQPEVTIHCMSPVEIGADKLSALTWRVLRRDRNAARDDATMIRHLHDLSALKNIISSDKQSFINTANAAFEKDQSTRTRSTGDSFISSIQAALLNLKSDTVYRSDYGQFVDAMSYADDDEVISFDTALLSLEEILSLF